MNGPIFLLDSDVFIEAWKTHYAPDVFTSYWEWFKTQAHAGTIRTVTNCYDDLCVVKDGLAEWVTDNCPDDFVISIDQDPAVIAEYRRLIAWATGHPRYLDVAKIEFAGVSDSWLIATALARKPNHILVTRETADPVIKKRFKIPNVCDELGVPCISALQWLRDLNAKI